jgi:hypothetical protein
MKGIAMSNSKASVMETTITSVRVLPLHRMKPDVPSIEQAIEIIQSDAAAASKRSDVKYEIEIRYSNGNKVCGQFTDNDHARQFLRSFQIPFRPNRG